MSYSFVARGANKAAAKAAVAAELAKVIDTQKVHERDRAAAQANADAMIDLLADDDTQDVVVSCHGSVSWKGLAEDVATVPLTGAAAGANAYYAPRA